MTRPQAAARPLSERDREVLKAIILAYVVEAEPVSSRAVARRSGLGLSAATIRNVMADLEEAGYLAQPHTSAGRVPTAAAYHLFIESMMTSRRVPAHARRRIEEQLLAAPGDAEQLMGATSQLLSELSRQVGIVVAPAMGDTVLRTLDFVPISGNKVLCVVVSTSGFVDNKVVETDAPIGRETLVQITNYINESFAGMTLRAIRDRLLAMMSEERAQVDRLLGLTIELARHGLELGDGPRVLVEGASSVLAHPELSDIQRVRVLFDTFANQARLVKMLAQCIEGEGVRVMIGEDSDLTSPLDFSLVATRYGSGEKVLGTLGIFGPSRMEYDRVIPLVHYLGETLSLALSEGDRGAR
ncbi:MAG TPA: heat-inducible transcriptional repressor HrcA [Thermoanaerobaculia bacterium]|nr:heat-inducible transcriptional repressor HrcA [Thermoanaerobaculia bacterium]